MHRDMESNSALEQALCRLYQSEEPPAGFETGWRAAVRREESMMRMAEKSTRRPLWRAIVPACAALVLVVGSLWAGTLDMGLEAAPSKKGRGDQRGICEHRFLHLGQRAQRHDGAVCRYRDL